jgi:hypothetical protein
MLPKLLELGKTEFLKPEIVSTDEPETQFFGDSYSESSEKTEFFAEIAVIPRSERVSKTRFLAFWQ